MNRKYRLYVRSVLCYWRQEWTDISDEDFFEFQLNFSLNKLLKNCFETSTNVPNAAKEVSIFTNMNAENS